MMAQADQEMTMARALLDELIGLWHTRQTEYDAVGLKDPGLRLCAFMYHDVCMAVVTKYGDDATGLWVLALANAIPRLGLPQPDPLDGLLQ
jgi:hypothetical protein